ncbi:MAG TPA: hypothetical protein VGQ76_28175 [Thermoanaerobaculia bacterium]|jgi:hypothetical protein|nr:hypothetical protein [Thermoanaerobaculia bacterium]
MAFVVRAFPVRDRSGVDAFLRALSDRETEARAFYNDLGVRRETWFYQKKSDGNGYVIGVTDVAEPIESKAAQYAEASDPFSNWFKAHIYALSGIDPDVVPLGPVTEIVHDSTNGSLPLSATLIVRAYPLRDRPTLEKFLGELRARPEETRDFYDRHQAEEAWFVQNTEEGPIVIAVLATDDPVRAAKTYAESTTPFDVWFKQRVIELSGVDPNRTPLGPPSEKIFEFTA